MPPDSVEGAGLLFFLDLFMRYLLSVAVRGILFRQMAVQEITLTANWHLHERQSFSTIQRSPSKSSYFSVVAFCSKYTPSIRLASSLPARRTLKPWSSRLFWTRESWVRKSAS